MINNAGIGIAMEGSIPEIINISNYVTENNNNDGVAKALEKYIL